MTFLDKSLVDKFIELQDNQSGAFLLFCGTTRWLSWRLDMIVAVYVAILSFAFVPISADAEFAEKLGLTPGSGES